MTTKIKLMIVGDSGVGKSNILSQYTNRSFSREHVSTIGVNFEYKNGVGSRGVKIHIYDTAGQERFASIVNNFYRGAAGVIIVYDVTDPTSFDVVDRFRRDVERLAPMAKMMLVGNKADLEVDRDLRQRARDYAVLYGIDLIEVSALRGDAIDDIFVRLVDKIVESGVVDSDEKDELYPRESRSQQCVGCEIL